jgi:hypothetical protein
MDAKLNYIIELLEQLSARMDEIEGVQKEKKREPLEKLLEKISIVTIDKPSSSRTTSTRPTPTEKFVKDWNHAVVASILRLCKDKDEFNGGDVKEFAFELMDYIGASGKTPANTISRVLTTKLRDEFKMIEAVGVARNSNYRIIDRQKMIDFVGKIPRDFSV